ncbi:MULTISPECIES: dermonecrotic toxin domain-containing protein [unclassified Pseudomonas]|uniref:dermonecrotic toxin domain-containing protein n=1 Tax=unclassified Pseudomonas TaxID=196821 RepID=UPI002AC8DAE2|nr:MULTISPECIES: DUF6543 domain-containing protein [unclassified Pseudomonas]MEB0046784.1 hypothetical protein [Pseudomonas sp. Dout3]MEB0097608.1 hypothetical protein [Pseudomonas sp. DC1.2]WPX61257.1 hypothetical protein RHM68_11660 [Pseudomonas sp. DC1.2]
MTARPLPYFFDEADLASNKKQPDARENALGFTVADLKWLKAVYFPNHAARAAQVPGMRIDRLLLTPTIALAGVFTMSKPDNGEAVLYTPWKGLTKFADMDDLKAKVGEWLGDPAGKRELSRYLSIEERNTALTTEPLILTIEQINGAVFQDQEGLIERNQQKNLTAMLGELLKFPTLRSMLDDALKMALASHFPKLDQRYTRLKSFGNTFTTHPDAGGAENRHELSSLSLNDAVLYFYLSNSWPEGDKRAFAHPAHRVSSEADNQAWELAIKEIAQSFTPYLLSQLETFWNSAMSNGLSRSDFFAQSMRDTYCVELLLKRQKAILSTAQYLQLMDPRITGQEESADSSNPIRIEKVRVVAPYRKPIELASTLMIGISDTTAFLYSQARGIETSGNLADIKKTLLDMMKSAGHEDNLLNVLALEERDLLVSLGQQERLIAGEPIVGPVFQQLMTDIKGKQSQNLAYALGQYRESEGNLDPHALLDNVLDIRVWIDKRLLEASTNGRWSTRADQRWSAQPATVRAASAIVQSAMLSSVDHALQEQLEKHPPILASTTTVTKAEGIVSESLKLLRPKFAHTLSTALRSELKLRSQSRTLSAEHQAIIQTVLDTPVRLQRGTLNGFLPDVFSLALKAGSADTLLKLASCFVATERGGLDLEHSGKAILWTPALGFEAYPSLTPLFAELNRRLLSDVERLVLLENLGRSERAPGQLFSLAPLQLIHGHFLEQLQTPYVQLDKTSVEIALTGSLPSSLRADLLCLTALATPMSGLQRAMDLAQSLITRQKLPAWLANASMEDQVLHAELLTQYVNNASDNKDYLSGIRALERTAHHELKKQLNEDEFDIDPDTVAIKINPRALFDAQTQTLPAFALTHWHDLNSLSFKPVSLNTAILPAALDENYLRGLVRNLKSGEYQRAILHAAFEETNADAASRRKRFATQLPWQLMHYAHGEKLQERLSESGFDLIRQIMNMPDAIAREAVVGTNAIIRPLELLGSGSESLIQIPGTYLIGPKPDTTGPQILLAPYSPQHGLKEYETEGALLAELKSTGPLQNWVLNTLSPADQVHCKSRLTSTSEISLASNPVRGNLFKQLFNDNARLLARLLACQSNTNAQGEWETIKRVLGKDRGQAFTLLPGKLVYPVTVWRSYGELKESAEDLQENNWVPAAKKFISGITQLAMLRLSMERHEPSPPTPTPTPETAVEWQHIDVTDPARTRMQRYESTEVTLSDLTSNHAQGIYTDPATQKNYAAVEGKVYPINKRGQRWRIRANNMDGPPIVQDVAKRWVTHSAESVRSYSLTNRVRTWLAVRSSINVEADGMSEIRKLFPIRARLINEGLDLATTYAWNSFRNLQLLKAPGTQVTPVHQLIMDFLDVPAVLPEHVVLLEKIVTDIFAGLLDPTLRKEKSKRFVVGRNLEEPENVFGFVVLLDRAQKIYLAEKFFQPNFDHYRNYMTDAAFPISAHARAATLLHELSHIVSNTEDIIYLDSSRPFVDLIETSSARAKRLKDTLSRIQNTGLSKKSSLAELFKIYNDEDNIWEDLGATTYENTDAVLARVLSLTGQATLTDARTTFMNNSTVRLVVQLANADSVTWLISYLGRKLHVNTP